MRQDNVTKLLTDIQVMKGKQESMDSKLVAMKQYVCGQGRQNTWEMLPGGFFTLEPCLQSGCCCRLLALCPSDWLSQGFRWLKRKKEVSEGPSERN